MKVSKTLSYKKINEKADFDYEIYDEKLGSGSFGEVFLGYDKINNKKVAIKCCNIEQDGIPKIFEASLMSSINHPYINKSLNVISSKNKLYIIQDLAKSDLNKYTKSKKLNINLVKILCWKLCQAIYCLHEQNIIHADIKPSNVLIYDDNDIKISDFSLSIIYLKNNIQNYTVCTSMYRPFECFSESSWDKSLDIWSLACTMFQIAYGDYLFPYQGILKNRKDREIMRKRCISSIFNFNNFNPKEKIKKEINYEDFKPFNNLFSKSKEYSLFNDLLFSMLRIDKNKRLTINEVLKHNFFKGMKKVNYMIYKHKEASMNVNNYIKDTSEYSNDTKVIKLANDIFEHSYGFYQNIYDKIKFYITCIWISNKIYNKQPHLFFITSLEEIIEMEREISNSLGFRLHVF